LHRTICLARILQSVVPLELFDRCNGPRIHFAGRFTRQIPQIAQAALHAADFCNRVQVAKLQRNVLSIVPLADLLPSSLLPRISLIKIDVEGTEADALAGLEPILESLPAHVAIVCELSPKHIATRGSTVGSLLNRMRVLGFRAYRITNVYGGSAYLSKDISPPYPLVGEVDDLADVVFLRSASPER